MYTTSLTSLILKLSGVVHKRVPQGYFTDFSSNGSVLFDDPGVGHLMASLMTNSHLRATLQMERGGTYAIRGMVGGLAQERYFNMVSVSKWIADRCNNKKPL